MQKIQIRHIKCNARGNFNYTYKIIFHFGDHNVDVINQNTAQIRWWNFQIAVKGIRGISI